MTDRARGRLAADPSEILESLGQTIVQVDDAGSIVAVNHPWSEVFARRPVPGELLATFLGVESGGLVESLTETARRSGRAEGEFHVAGRDYRIEVTRLESAPAFVIAFDDVTGRRRTEQVLMETMHGKSRVLSTVGKELQEPLGAVLAYAKLLAQPEPDFDDTYRYAVVEHMAGQAWELAGIIDDLLAVAHTEIGDLHVAQVPVNLFANTAQVLESMGDRGRQITVTGDRSIMAMGDPARLRQIVRNLLSNALTHGSEPIAIDVSASDTRSYLRVKDRGGGVPSEVEAQGLFSKPIEDPSAPERIGIGLWVASELADLMNGHLDYRREYGLTTFEVALQPLAS